ncbi:MAG: 23S rRNA (uracil(1939)-C(5))-methyltransferase RlmD [Candidatus Omnitrophota bacterium]
MQDACQYFPTCGGCDFRDKSYPEQLEYKEKFCRNLLARFEVSDFRPIIPSPQTEYYRHKMDFCAGKAPEGIILGMRQKSRATAVVDVKECLVFSKEAGFILEVFRKWAKDYSVPAYELYKHSGEFRYVSLRHSKFSGKVMVVGVFALSPEEFFAQTLKFQDLAGRLQNIPEVASIYICLNNKMSDETLSEDLRLWAGEKYIQEKINGISYLSSPSIFLQSNPFACGELYSEIKQAVVNCGGGGVLDMYCGSGGITLQLVDAVSKITAVDFSARNIEDARENAKLNGLNNIEFICEDAEAFLSRANPNDFSILILDPPRQGLSKKTLKIVLECGIKNIIYVSCNPLNLRQDLISLCEFYKLDKAVPVDMFPHTRHVELVVTLSLV